MVKLITCTQDIEKLLADSFAKCYKSQPKIETVIKFMKHESVLEHVVFTFDIKCSRLTHTQFVRHRIASYTSQSHRYTEPTMRDSYYYIPTEIDKLSEELQHEWIEDSENAYKTYHKWVDKGVSKQTARYLINDGVGIEFRVTMNLRTLMNFFKLRLDAHAQEEIREIAEVMKELTFAQMPNLRNKLQEILDESAH